MPVSANEKVRVTLPIGDEEAIFTFPSWSDPDLQKAIRKLVTGRQEIKRNQVKDISQEARITFFDSQALDVENYGEPLPGGKWDMIKAATHPNWKDLVPPSWKTSCAAYFEERNVLQADDLKN